MKRLDNQGFAIGTILYGLLIVMVLLMSLLMSTMAFGRSNSKKYVDEIANNLEKRETAPPKVNIKNIPQNITIKEPYTALTIKFDIEISDDNSIIVLDDFVTYDNTAVNCTLNSSSTSNKKIYNCSINISNTEATPGKEVKISIEGNKIRDRFHNWYSKHSISLNYKFEEDTTPPTITPYRVEYLNDNIKYKLLVCDNSGKNVQIDYSKANNITVAGGIRLSVNATDNNNCKLISVNSSLIRNVDPIPVKIPEGVFKDKYNNGNVESTINFLNPLPDKSETINNSYHCQAYAYILSTNGENGLLLTPEFKNDKLKYKLIYKINNEKNGKNDDVYKALKSKCDAIKDPSKNEKLKIKYANNNNISISDIRCESNGSSYTFTYNIERKMLDQLKQNNSGYSSRLFLIYPVTKYNVGNDTYTICEMLYKNYYVDTGLDY